jgi:hypothetical protein
VKRAIEEAFAIVEINWLRVCLAALVGAVPSFLTVTVSAGSPAPRVYLRLNQAGYRPGDVKVAIAFSEAAIKGRFIVTEAAGNQVVYDPKVRPAAAARWGRFNHHAELDFSKLTTPGRYCLRLGEAVSAPFVVASNAHAVLPDQLLEFMRQQRCGYNPWLDAQCHQADGRTAYGPMPPGTPLDARGGWHDAADLLKYLLTSANATAQMLLACQLAPAAFADRVNESGKPGPNGIADVLDEARWGLDWMLKLHPQPDQLYHQVADDRDHWGWRLPPDEKADYGWGKGGPRVVYAADGQPQGLRRFKSESTGVANLAGRYAAAMALAYETWRDHPQLGAFAQRCLQAGVEVYALGRRQEGVQQGNSYGAPYRYAETTWADDMEWGAAELYRATGENRYLEDAERYARLAADTSWMGRTQTGHYQYYPFVNLGHFALHRALAERSLLSSPKMPAPQTSDGAGARVSSPAARGALPRDREPLRRRVIGPAAGEDTRAPLDRQARNPILTTGSADPLAAQVARYYRAGIQRCVRAGARHPYRAGAPAIWCSNNLTVALATQCLLYERMTGETRYRAFAAAQRDWLLGRNPWGYSMFLGIPAGGVYPRRPHLMTTRLTGRSVCGGLVDGPVYERIFKSLRGVSITEPDPLAPFQSERAVYHDDVGDYSTNEPTMDGTASAILMFALLAEESP